MQSSVCNRGPVGWYVRIKYTPGEHAEVAPIPSATTTLLPNLNKSCYALLWNTTSWQNVSPPSGRVLHIFNSAGVRSAVLSNTGHTGKRQIGSTNTVPYSSTSCETVHPGIFNNCIKDVIDAESNLIIVINAHFTLPVKMTPDYFNKFLLSYRADAIIVTQEGLKNIKNAVLAGVGTGDVLNWPSGTRFIDDESDESISLILYGTSHKLAAFNYQCQNPDVFIKFDKNIMLLTNASCLHAGNTYVRVRGKPDFYTLDVYVFDNHYNSSVDDLPSFSMSGDCVSTHVCSEWDPHDDQLLEQISIVHLAANAYTNPLRFLGNNVAQLIESKKDQPLVNAAIDNLRDTLCKFPTPLRRHNSHNILENRIVSTHVD